MGTRIKTFEATGLAPNGRLYAGDLNAIQDQYADVANFAQSVDVGDLSIGDSTLSILKYGTAEMRLTGALRVDAILRGLGGLYAGAFTTAQRDAIASGKRPYGLVILNTTTNQYEWNKGTDASPSWWPLGGDPTMQGIPIGGVVDWPWAAGLIPSWALLPYGQAISRATYAALHTLASSSAYPYGNGDGSTTFNLPDFRGRSAIGKDDMGGSAASRLTVGISGVGGTTLGAVGGVEGITLTTGQIPAHNHGVTDPQHFHGYTQPATPSPGFAPGGSGATIGGAGANTDSRPTGISIQNAGGGGVHANVHPVVVVNKFLRAL